MEYKLLNLEKKNNGVYTVQLNRPDVHNAFNDDLIAELIHVFEGINSDDKARLVTLTGTGKSFCAGADLNWMKSMIEYSQDENFQDSKQLAKMFKTIDGCKVPVIGKLNGHALGGGVGVVAVCDYVISVDRAKFGFTEARLGLVPAVISPFVVRKIGYSFARAYFMSGAVFNAEEAMKMQLIHKVVPKEELEQEYAKVEADFLNAAPKASVSAKELINNDLHNLF